MDTLTILRQARDQGLVVEIDMRNGAEHYGCWVEKVRRTWLVVGMGDGSEPTFDIFIPEIKEVRIVS